MIADFKPYPAMMDSGVEWLGEVPEHWAVLRAKYLFQFIDKQTITDKKELLNVYGMYRIWISRLQPTDIYSKLPLPSFSEQDTISRYLDHVVHQIQQMVNAKRQMISLLTEQRQCIIHSAITRGLELNVSLKDTGVKWLGKVPEHWEVRRIRNVSNIRVSVVDKLINEGESPVQICNYLDVYKHDRIDKKINFMQATASSGEIELFRLVVDDVLITKNSETLYDIGIPALVTEPVNDLILGDHLALLRPFPRQLSGEYLLYAIQSNGLAYQFHVDAKGVTRYGLTQTSIKSVCLPLPPLIEQTSIVDHLNTATANIDTAIKCANHKIELLNEYNICLINKVVTGKIDVRSMNLKNV